MNERLILLDVYDVYDEEYGVEFYQGMIFEGDGILTGVKHVNSANVYQFDQSLIYNLVDNNHITVLGYNNDIIIVKRHSLSENNGDVLLECTSGDSSILWVTASSIDWSSGKVVTKDGREMVRYTLL